MKQIMSHEPLIAHVMQSMQKEGIIHVKTLIRIQTFHRGGLMNIELTNKITKSVATQNNDGSLVILDEI